jgi:hypothetical protein
LPNIKTFLISLLDLFNQKQPSKTLGNAKNAHWLKVKIGARLETAMTGQAISESWSM